MWWSKKFTFPSGIWTRFSYNDYCYINTAQAKIVIKKLLFSSLLKFRYTLTSRFTRRFLCVSILISTGMSLNGLLVKYPLKWYIKSLLVHWSFSQTRDNKAEITKFNNAKRFNGDSFILLEIIFDIIFCEYDSRTRWWMSWTT